MPTVTTWAPGTLYQPGDLVRATNSGVVTQPPIDNPGFEDGDTGWTDTGFGSFTIDTDPPVFEGSYSAKLGVTSNPNGQTLRVENDEYLAVTPGQIVTLRFYCYSVIGGDFARLMPRIQWYGPSPGFVEITGTTLPLDPTNVGGEARVNSSGLSSAAANASWTPIEFSGVAPAGAAFWRPRFDATWGDSSWMIDSVSYSYAVTDTPNTLIFRAVQAAAGFSGSSEPTWPTSIGLTVVDNEVTWEAVSGNSVTWEASRILVTGAVEPTWPLIVNGAVVDNTISWVLDPRRVTDSRVPTDSTVVLLASSKVFAADDDIINFSATVNPLDWSTPNDAGYIGFGLQQYGGTPVTAMGLYRGNLAAFNSQGCQLWQLDEDPAGITYLDAIPVACTYPKTVNPVGDDLGFLSNLGIRSLGLSGASVNLQGGYFGQQVDELVLEALAAAIADTIEPISLYWPARGQAWWIFDSQAFVLTITAGEGGKINRSWSRYTFPSEITDWTIHGEELLLRSGDLVWQVDPDALIDDLHLADSPFHDFGNGGVQYGPNPWAASDLTLDVGGSTAGLVSGDNVYLFGNTLTGTFAELAVTGLEDESTLRTSVALNAAVDVGDVIIVKFPAEGPITVGNGNSPGSELITLDEPIANYWRRGTVLRITRAGGTDYNYIAEDVEPGATEIPLATPLVNTITNIRVWPAGSVLFNSNDNLVAYVPFVITAINATRRRITIDGDLPADVTALPAIATQYQATTVDSVAGTIITLTDATAFATTGGTSPELGFPEQPVVAGPFAQMQEGTEFEGVIQWPFLDWKAPGLDKELVGFDLVINGDAEVSIGYNQRQLDYTVGGYWTEPFEISGDTLPDEMIPYSCSGPTLAFRLRFEPRQRWEWFAANLYVKDLDR